MSRPKPKHALPEPWHKRKLVWAGGTVVAVLLVVVVVKALGGGGDPFVEPSFNTTSTSSTTSTTTTTVPEVECIDVRNPSLLTTIDAEVASAVEVSDGWFVAKANGATWLTTAEPTRDAAGELLPMNDQARADSESRRDVPDGDPLYNGHTDDEPEADAARTCAA